MLHFDVMATLAIATLILLLGQHIKRQVPVLHRYNLPSPVIGGLLAAIALLLCKVRCKIFTKVLIQLTTCAWRRQR